MLDTAPDPLADTAASWPSSTRRAGAPSGEAGTRLDRNVRLYLR